MALNLILCSDTFIKFSKLNNEKIALPCSFFFEHTYNTSTSDFNAPPTPSMSKSPQDDPETPTPTCCTSHSLPTGLQAMLATIIANQNTMMKTLKAVLHQSRRWGDPSEDPSEKIREVLEEPISSLDALVVFDLKLRG